MRIAIILSLVCCALSLATPAAAQALKPAQVAYLKAEIRRAQERYVTMTAAISGVPAAKIRDWVPTDGRDVPPKLNVIAALERTRGKPFTEEERKRLVTADQERFDAVEQARREALRR